MKYQDKLVFITGAGSGIGRQAALSFGQMGADLALSDWNAESLEETMHMMPSSSTCRSYELDVSKYDDVKGVIDQVMSDFGQIDVALNNAGLGGKQPRHTAEHSLEDWDLVIAVNQSGVFYCMKEQLRVMKAQGFGSIVNVSSIAGLRALPMQIAYVASKHAVIGMTKTAALEYAKYGIRVNAVCPVFTNSPLLEQLFTMKEGLREKLVHSIPVGRYGETADIVHAIQWLSDPASSFITGLCLPVDGGQSA